MMAVRVLAALLLLPVSPAGIALVVPWREPLAPRLTFDASAVDRVECGMSQQEIAELLGVPPGDYRTRSDVHYSRYVVLVGHLHGVCDTSAEWCFNSRHLHVSFAGGKAISIARGPGLRRPMWIEKLLGIRIFPPVISDE